MGTWNARGINETVKREEVVDVVFRKGNFELLALVETQLKGNRNISWWGVRKIVSLLEFSRWKELGKVWPSC